VLPPLNAAELSQREGTNTARAESFARLFHRSISRCPEAGI
jgi:hypothetical protein